MKIKRLLLKNVRAHEDTEINLDHINIFVGPEGAGKTTIKASIEQLLTGRCQFTGKKGEESDDLIRDGAKKALITADMTPFGIVTRHIPNALEVQAIKGSLTVLQNAIYDRLKVDDDVISAMLNTDKFAAITSDEQKKMLFALMGLKFNKESVHQALSDFLVKNGYQDQVKDLLAKFDKLCPADLAGGGECLDTLDTLFRDERKAAKKTRDNLKALAAAPNKSQLPANITTEDKPGIIDTLTQLKDRRSQLLIDIGKADSANQRDTLVKRIEANRQEVTVTEKQLSDLSQEDINPVLEAMAQTKGKLTDARKKEEAARTKLTDATAAVNGLAKAMGAIRDAKEDCPLAPGHVKCAMTAEQKDKLLDDMDKDLAKLKTAKGKAEKALQDAQKFVTSLDTEVNQIQVKIDRSRTINLESDRLTELIGNLAKQISQDEKMLNELPEAVCTTTLQEELDQLNQRIPKGEAILQIIIVEETRAAEREKTEEKLLNAEDEVAVLEILVKAFSPKGIKAAKLSSIMDKIQAKANECAEVLTGGKFQIKFDTSEDFDILVTKQGGRPKKIKKLSGSEQMQMGIILQIILNQLTGLRFLVIDNTEVLGQRVKGLLFNLLMLIKDNFDTIIVNAILGEVVPSNPGIPGLAMFMVQDGKVEPIPVMKQEAAAG